MPGSTETLKSLSDEIARRRARSGFMFWFRERWDEFVEWLPAYCFELAGWTVKACVGGFVAYWVLRLAL